MDTLELKLRKPVKLGDITYDTIKLEEPTAGQLEQSATASTGIGSVMNLISAVGKLPRGVVEKLSQRDFQEAANFLESFNSPDPTTGSTSSLS